MTIAILFLVVLPANATTQPQGCVLTNDGHQICSGAATQRTRDTPVIVRNVRTDANGNGVIGRRPAGCPHRFCGCEASLYLFGKIRPELNLAANWIRKFPRASPAPRMAAARRGHVMVLISHVEGSKWLVHDGNSGGGLTRRHVRSISGYTIVNPHGSQLANL